MTPRARPAARPAPSPARRGVGPRDVRRNLALLDDAARRQDWTAVVRLAEGLVRLAVCLAARTAANLH